MKPCSLVTSVLKQNPLNDVQVRGSFDTRLWVLLYVWCYSPTQINQNLGISNSKLSKFVNDDLLIKGYEVELLKDLLRQTVAQAEKRADTLSDFHKDILLYKIKVTKSVLGQ
jgi:hypothetical protein